MKAIDEKNENKFESSVTEGRNNLPSRELRKEGPVARGIEQQTSKVPSDVFLWSALTAIGGSLVLQLTGKKEVSNFVGQWAPTLLILGLYNKLVKVAGSDSATGPGLPAAINQ